MQAVDFIFSIIVIIMSVVVHEVSHGYMANALGDPTAKYAGRLTLNPLKHLDPMGSVIVPILTRVLTSGQFMFGWAKPVPYNPYNLKAGKWGPALVALAGPLSNFALALIFGLTLRSGLLAGLVPASFVQLTLQVILVNIVLGVFNLIPVSPLDGSTVIFSFLPYKYNYIQKFIEQYQYIFFFILIFFFWNLLAPIVVFLFQLMTGLTL
jgi:Zn-dependent protease